MLHWIAKTLRARATGLASAMLVLTPATGWAQAPPPIQPAQFDPSDVYFQGYLSARAAEQLEADGEFIEAADKLRKARESFAAVARFYPDWKPDMVKGRIAINSEAEIRVHPLAEEQRLQNRNAVAELEGGQRMPGTTVDPAEGVMPLSPSVLEVDPLVTRRLAEAEAELQRLRGLAETNRPGSDEASRNQSRVTDLARQRDAAQSELRAAERTVQGLRSQLARSPAENQMKALNARIADKEQERQAMAMALTQSRASHTDALAKIATLQADLTVMRQRYADLDRNLKSEREIANSVVVGQRAQLQELEKKLTAKDTELAQAHERIASLVNELEESREAFVELRDERDSLLQERDQMSALLKLNEDGRIQDLIQQNMGLAKNLREANEKVEALNLDNNNAKDDITDALRDLAIAKSQINKLHQEKRAQDERLAELEKRLKSEENSLAAGQGGASPEEVEVLREIVRKQLRVQERRRQARDLLVEAVKQMGSQDERIAQAVKLFDGEELQLSPEEQRLIAGTKVDGEFISPFAQDRGTVDRNTDVMNRDIAVYERTAERSFAAGRYLPTRELFRMIIEQHPGHIPALCKLGVVDLKLEDAASAVDSFRRAVELDEKNAYAHRMLAYSFYVLGDLPGAESTVKQALDLAPVDAKSQFLLAAICDRLGRSREAESHYKASITADPLASEAYYQLAVLCARAKRFEEARAYYAQALERGALPDPELEKLLSQP